MKIKYIYIFFICLTLIGCSKQKDNTKGKRMDTIPNKAITIDALEQMFTNMTKKSDWDMNKPMLWGYFFTHHEPKLLEKTKAILVQKGYRFVDIYLSDKEDVKDPDMWWLHVEKEEIHTPQSLDKKNDEFYLFANDLGLDSYDGMDVGPINNK